MFNTAEYTEMNETVPSLRGLQGKERVNIKQSINVFSTMSSNSGQGRRVWMYGHLDMHRYI